MPFKLNPFTGNLDAVNDSGISTANADARYLKLDASNDPVTGALLLRNASNSTVAFDVQTSGSAVVFRVDTTNSFVGAGTSVPDSTFHANRVFTGNTSGQALHVSVTQSGNNTGFPRALFAEAESSPTGSTNTLAAITGVARNTGAGTITNVRGFNMLLNPTSGAITNGQSVYSSMTNGAAAARIVNASHFYADTPTNAGSITNTYGFYAAPQVAGTQGSTPYSFYGAGTADRSYFAGSVGIGVTAPSRKLHVRGEGDTYIRIDSGVTDASAFVEFYDDSSQQAYVGFNGPDTRFDINVQNNVPLVFFTGGTERARIDEGGSVSIGTTVATDLLTVNGNIGALSRGDIRLYDTDSSNYVAFQAGTVVGTNVIWTLPTADGTAGQVLSTNGTATLSWTTPSSGATFKQTEVDFGTTPVSEASFAVTDASVGTASKILAQVAYEAPTGKDLDELEMDTLDIKCAPGAGTLTMYIKSLEGYVADKFKINYVVG